MNERIVRHPSVHFGKPCIIGTRIPVEGVLELVAEGVLPIDIIRDYYPDLSYEDIVACIDFAGDRMYEEAN